MTALAAGGPEVEINGDEPTALYRFYDGIDRLLYVGITNNLITRWADHRAEKPWWPQVSKRTVVLYGSRGEAEDAEKTAIRMEQPIHNVVGRSEPRPKRSARKLPSELQQRLEAFELARSQSFTLDKEFLASIDAYAKDREVDRRTALGVLLLTGIRKVEEEDTEHKAQVAALRAEIAEIEANLTAQGVDVPVAAG